MECKRVDGYTVIVKYISVMKSLHVQAMTIDHQCNIAISYKPLYLLQFHLQPRSAV